MIRAPYAYNCGDMICRLHAHLVDRRRRAGNGDGVREAVTALVDLGIGRHVAEIVTVTAGSVVCTSSR